MEIHYAPRVIRRGGEHLRPRWDESFQVLTGLGSASRANNGRCWQATADHGTGGHGHARWSDSDQESKVLWRATGLSHHAVSDLAQCGHLPDFSYPRQTDTKMIYVGYIVRSSKFLPS
jgi:hypothetical protein